MQLATLDWIILVICLVLIFAPALFFARRANRSTAEFFASGRSAPWWLVGTSMVATTFATDTPGLVAQFVRESGVAKNWLWWALLLSGMATVFFYARLWRRAGLLTDLEFYEIRYSGSAAKFLRGFRAVFLGLIVNCAVMAIVTLAAVKIANLLLGVSPKQTILFAIIACSLLSAVSGLWGVLVSDLVQFGLAMTGSIAAAVYALRHPAVGGLDGLVAGLDPDKLRMVPDFGGDTSILWTIFLFPLLVQWWATWYPGSEPGGGSYIAQRILAAKNERHAVGATLWFNIAHYALRPWPWVIVGLASLLVFPNLDALRAAFPNVQPDLVKDDIAYSAMLTFVPAGMLGLIVASLLAAYVSTMSTQINLGASYLVHDLYRRFIRSDASERHYVRVSRGLTVCLMVIAGLVSLQLESSGAGFTLLITLSAGTGSVYLLRWFWWRINAWSEIAAMVSSTVLTVTFFVLDARDVIAWNPLATLSITVAVTTLIWVVVTLITRPDDKQKLIDFVRHTQPAGPGWRPIRRAGNLPPATDNLWRALACWVLGCVVVYSVLFSTGNMLLGDRWTGMLLGAIAMVGIVMLFALLRRNRTGQPVNNH